MALTRLPEIKHELGRVSKNILRDVRSILSQWLLGAHASTKIDARFQRRILNPAIKFHQDFNSSYHRYTMEPIKDLSDLSPKEMLNEWHLKAADTWGQVKTEDQVGTALYCLHPGLVRRRPGGADPVTIVKPVVVITRPETQRILNNQSKQEPVPSNATEQPAFKNQALQGIGLYIRLIKTALQEHHIQIVRLRTRTASQIRSLKGNHMTGMKEGLQSDTSKRNRNKVPKRSTPIQLVWRRPRGAIILRKHPGSGVTPDIIQQWDLEEFHMYKKD